MKRAIFRATILGYLHLLPVQKCRQKFPSYTKFLRLMVTGLTNGFALGFSCTEFSEVRLLHLDIHGLDGPMVRSLTHRVKQRLVTVGGGGPALDGSDIDGMLATPGLYLVAHVP